MSIDALIYTSKFVMGIPHIDPGVNSDPLGDDDLHYRVLLNDSTGPQKLCTSDFSPIWMIEDVVVPNQYYQYFGTDGCSPDETYDRGTNDSLFERVSPSDPSYVGTISIDCDSEGTLWIFGQDFNTSDTSELRVRTIQTDGTVTEATINIDDELPAGNPPGHSGKSYNSSTNNRPFATSATEVGGIVIWQTNYGTTGPDLVSPRVLMKLEKTLTTINTYFITYSGDIVEQADIIIRGKGGGGVVAITDAGDGGFTNISNTGVATDPTETTDLKLDSPTDYK